MTERALRKFHRTWGILLANLVALHLVTCLLLAMERTVAGPDPGSGLAAALAFVLNHWLAWGSWWRLFLSFSAAVQALTGLMLFSLILARPRQPQAHWDEEAQRTSAPLPPTMAHPSSFTPF